MTMQVTLLKSKIHRATVTGSSDQGADTVARRSNWTSNRSA